MWYVVHSSYEGKLDDAHDETRHWHETAARWQSDADYYQDVAKHPVAQQTQPQPQAAAPQERPRVPPRKMKPPSSPAGPSVSSSPNKPDVSAPGGVAVGGNNNGVINNGSVPRSLTPSLEASLGDAIGPPVSEFDGVFCIMGDSESCRLAEQIRAVFSAHGWPNTDKGLNQAAFNRPMPGIFVAIDSAEASAPTPAVLQVYSAFRANGINIFGTKINGLKPGHFYILVGSNLPAP